MSWFFGSSEPNDPAAVKRRTGYQAPGTVLGPGPANTGTAVPRGTADPTTLGGGPTPPDASLAASNAAIAAQAAADKARKKATAGSGATVLTGLPGSNTPAPKLATKTLLGY